MTTPTTLLGGSGFIGTALARRLAASGEAPLIADIRPSAAYPASWRRADARDASQVAAVCAGAGVLVLLAGEHGLEPRPARRFFELNVGGARAVVDAAERTGLRRIVFVSTVAVYGRRAAVTDEHARCRPTGAYGRSKLDAEDVLRAWAGRDDSRSLVIVRPTLVFGPGVRGHARSLLLHLAHPGMVMIGSGANRKSLAHVDNLAAFLARLREAEAGVQIFNYCDEPDLSLSEMSGIIRDALRLGPPRLRRSRAAATLHATLVAAGLVPDAGPRYSFAQIRGFSASSRYAAPRVAATGFRPPLPLAEALRRYALSDLRWASPFVRSATPAELHVHPA